jgi:hypothetical protein
VLLLMPVAVEAAVVIQEVILEIVKEELEAAA